MAGSSPAMTQWSSILAARFLAPEFCFTTTTTHDPEKSTSGFRIRSCATIPRPRRRSSSDEAGGGTLSHHDRTGHQAKEPKERAVRPLSSVLARTRFFEARFRHKHDPEKWSPVFGSDHAHEKGRRNAGRRAIQPPHPAGCGARAGGTRRLSAFHHGTCGSERTPPLSSRRSSWDVVRGGGYPPSPVPVQRSF